MIRNLRDPGDFRSGFLKFKKLEDDTEDIETLYLANERGQSAHVPGIYVPDEIMRRYGVLSVTVISRGRDHRPGDQRDLGTGVLIPHLGGLQLRNREEPRRSMLKVTVIRDIIKDEVWVHLVFTPKQ